MKENKMQRGHAPYETPEAEVIVFAVEVGFMGLSTGETGNSSVNDLEEENSWDNPIWS